MARSLSEIRELVRERSPFSAAKTDEVLEERFASLPRRLSFALARWQLDRFRVLDVGCAFGHCLIHFGPGSIGIDSSAEQIAFCRALGLEARLGDLNEGVDVPDRSFDYAWVSDVIEHLDAPRVLLRSVRSKLAAEGRLLLFLTTAPESRLVRAAARRYLDHGFDAAAHHYQFTAATARFMVERAGFAVEALVAPARALPVSLSPRLFLVARPDEAAEQIAREAERRNRGRASASST
jgi:SAM-dependent methyltransferase